MKRITLIGVVLPVPGALAPWHALLTGFRNEAEKTALCPILSGVHTSCFFNQ